MGSSLGYLLFIGTAGQFILPVQSAFGWSRLAVTVAPLVGLAAALVAPLAGPFIDRIGIRPSAIAGLLAMTILFLAFAAMPASLAIMYVIAALVALASPFSSPMVFSKGIATWFDRHMGLAQGLVMSGVAVVFALANPLLTYIIGEFGWRVAYAMLAAMIALFALPAVLWNFREGPIIAPTAPSRISQGSGDRGFLRGLSGNARFWILFAFFVTATVGIGGYVSQLVPLLESLRISPMSAGSIVSIYWISIAVGRIALGSLLDRLPPTLVAGLAMISAACGTVLLSLVTDGNSGRYAATFAMFLIGLAHGAEVDFVAFFTMRIFGARHYSTLFGIFGGLATGGGLSIGGLLFAFFFDRFGSYHVAILFSTACFCLSVLLMALLAHQGRRRKG